MWCVFQSLASGAEHKFRKCCTQGLIIFVLCVLKVSAFAQITFVTPQNLAALSSLESIAAGPDGVFYAITSSEYGQIYRLDTVPVNLTHNIRQGLDAAEFISIRVDSDGDVYVAVRERYRSGNDRIMKLNGTQWELLFMAHGDVSGFNITPDKKVYVNVVSTQTYESNVFVYDPQAGTYTVAHPNPDYYGFTGAPVVDSQGAIYSVTYGYSHYHLRKSTGLDQWVEIPGSSILGVMTWQMTIDPMDNIYLTNVDAGRVLRYDGTSWATLLTGLNFPLDVAWTPERLAVAEAGSSSVRAFQFNTSWLVTSESNAGADQAPASTVQEDVSDGAGLSLTEAVYWAGKTFGNNTIAFDLSPTVDGRQGGTVFLNSPLNIRSSVLTIYGDVSGNGVSAVTISGENQTRLFDIDKPFHEIRFNSLSLVGAMPMWVAPFVLQKRANWCLTNLR